MPTASNDPLGAEYGHASRNVLAVNMDSVRVGFTWDDRWNRRMQSKGLVDEPVQVRQLGDSVVQVLAIRIGVD